MVECESNSVSIAVLVVTRFNRYMVECESFEHYINSFTRMVLIDTWWNVNLNDPSNKIPEETVLIDTWWNVNATGTDSNKNLSAF